MAEVLLIFLALSLSTEGMFITDPQKSIKHKVSNAAVQKSQMGLFSESKQSREEKQAKIPSPECFGFQPLPAHLGDYDVHLKGWDKQVTGAVWTSGLFRRAPLCRLEPGKLPADARHVASGAASLWQRLSYNFWHEFSGDQLQSC